MNILSWIAAIFFTLLYGFACWFIGGIMLVRCYRAVRNRRYFVVYLYSSGGIRRIGNTTLTFSSGQYIKTEALKSVVKFIENDINAEENTVYILNIIELDNPVEASSK